MTGILELLKNCQKNSLMEACSNLAIKIYKERNAPVAMSNILCLLCWVYLAYYEYEKVLEIGKELLYYCSETSQYLTSIRSYEVVGLAQH